MAKAFCGFDSSIEEAMLTKEVSIICLRVDTESLFVIANEDDDIEPTLQRRGACFKQKKRCAHKFLM